MRGRIRIVVASVVVASAVALGGTHFVGQSCAAATAQACSTPTFVTTGGGVAMANLWIDTSGGSCTRQVTPTAYNDPQACSSLSAAFSAAQCGDTIYVTPGSYSGNTFATSKGCTSNQIIFTTVDAVTFTSGVNFNESANHITFNGPFSYAGELSFNATTNTGASNINVINNTTNTTRWTTPHIWSLGHNLVYQNGSVGPNNNCTTGDEDGVQIYDSSSTLFPSNIDINNVVVHDISDNGNECSGFANSGVHTDCIQLVGASNITIENSTFYNCATSDVIGRPFRATMHDVLIQNNMMGPVVTPGASINIGNSADACTNVVAQYNTIIGTYPSLICGAGGSGNLFRGNITQGYFAQTGFTNSYNVSIDTSAVGTGSKQCSPTFLHPGSAVSDYHLSASDTCAKNAGNTAAGTYPSTDFDGDVRPAGSAPDVGADEVG